jgi:sugar transferase EpsL
MIESTLRRPSKLYPKIKRPLDAIAAGIALILAAPLIVVVAGIVRLTMGRSVLFRHNRPGLHEQPFTCLKFRTMTEELDDSGRPLPDEQRLTRVGSWLRRTSLDELPQLWNILRGDLSFIGPRPLLQSYLPFYTEAERRRHSVRPGLTGWAQTHGRNSLGFDERLAMDVWYVDHLSWQLDLSILLKTAWIVLTQKGFVQPNGALPPLDAERLMRVRLNPETIAKE